MKSVPYGWIAIGVVLCGLVGYVVFGPRLLAARSFNQATALFDKELAASHYQTAYDLLLTASRIDASQPTLLDLVEKFVSVARKSGDARAEDLADSLLARAEMLVPFHAPAKVGNARRRLDALDTNRALSELEELTHEDTADTDPVVSYLAVAERDALPLSLRSAAVEQARQMIDSTMLEVAVARPGDAGALKDRYKSILDRIDQAERICLKGLFDEWCAKRDGWKARVTNLLTAEDTPTTDDNQKTSKEVVGLVEAGMSLMQEVAPYSKAEVADAALAESELGRDLELLQRYRAWRRNQAVLKAVIDVEEHWSETAYETDLRKLADALQEEELLIPYVSERFNQKWNEAFSGLEEKRPENAPEMLKLRFLGRLLPKGDSK